MKRFHRIGALVLCMVAASVAAAPAPSGTFKVMGAVNNPGIYVIGTNGSTVISALNAAGRETDRDLKVTVIHKVSENLNREVAFNSISELRQHPEADIALDADDLVMVIPQSGPGH